MLVLAGKTRHHVLPVNAGAASPDDFVAGATYWGPPAAFRCRLRRLQDGAAVLHGRGLDGLLVLGHRGAGFIWTIAVSEVGVRDPRRSTGRTGTAGSCCGLGAWTERRKTFGVFSRALPCVTLLSLVHVCRHSSKNLLAQPPTDAVGVGFTHQQEQKLTIWLICSLGLGRRGSWLKAEGRKGLIRKDTTHTAW